MTVQTPIRRECELTDIRMVERGFILSPVDIRGERLFDAGAGEFQRDDSVMGEAYECLACGRQFEDNFNAALKHARGAQ